MESTTDTLIVISPDILSGTPVFAHTRVPVKNLLDYLRAGETVDAFLTDFPSVSRDNVNALLTRLETMLLGVADARAA